MNIVIEANILIAALLKDSKIRNLIMLTKHTLIIPEFVLDEINNHKEELIEKSNLSEQEFDSLLIKLLRYIAIIKTDKILPCKKEAELIIKQIDENDVQIIAASLAYNFCPIWTDDKHFLKQNKIKILTTKDVIIWAANNQ